MKKLSSIFLALLILSSASADDTELYVGTTGLEVTGRPKVLIILDNSGSMNNIVPGTKTSYDPATTYTTQGSINNSRIYWSTNGTPPGKNSDNYFLVDSNRCASSTTSLNTTGMYTDYLSAWRANKKGTYRWRRVNDSNGTRTSSYIDCKADVDDTIDSNPGTPVVGNGYPLNTNSGPYVGSATSSNVAWSKIGARTLFTANYMNWYHDASLATADRKRIDIAKDVVTNIIDANPNVDFGLMSFNYNKDGAPHGGRVTRGIIENMTAAQRTDLKSTVAGINATTWTPLCETMYEAYRYFSGGSVYYGDDESSPSPPRDTSTESSGNYISPIGDCQQVYVILMTDGTPTYDEHADSLIDGLSDMGSTSGNRLDELAGWLYSNDLDNDATNGVQRVVTYTIGFTIDHSLLSDTASKGGGRYYKADDATALTTSFQGAINEILITDTTFTSPAVAVNSFNRSRSLNDIYIAMFRPESGPRWHGNLKKYTIDDDGVIKDALGTPAIDPTTGNIRDTAKSHWSSAPDGGRVLNGGTGEVLANRNPTTRVLKVNSGTSGALENFNTSNTNLSLSDFGAATTTERDELINWARGIDIDDEDVDGLTTDTRPWLVGDPLHSQPLVINYGARSGFTTSNPDIRILMGTNHGFLHMFGASDGVEDWAFLPKNLLTLQKTLRENAASTDHPYGIDGSVAAHVIDIDRDGTISGSDKVYIYFGLRRGGNTYYAMDISDPDNPTFMWEKSATDTGFSEMGQSWATPSITYIPGYSNPVLVIGAGFDTNKDTHAVGTDDSKGRGILILDALNGALVWSVTPNAKSSTNLQHTDLTDSIPARVSVYDSNGDGVTDRLYVGDTGGNIWRVDMPGNALPDADQDTWSIFKLAELGGTTAADDRRFFNKIDVIRTRVGTLAYDGLAIGSGNRTHPNEKTVDDRFYMIRDTKVATSYHGTEPDDTPIPSPFDHTNLYDATDNLIQDGTTAEKASAITTLASKNGWYINLEKTGEKTVADSVTLDGKVYFTTFSPDTTTTSCVPVPGRGYLYAVDLHNATAVHDWDTSTTGLTKEDRTKGMGERLFGTPTPVFGEDKIRIIGVGAGDSGSGSEEASGPLETRGVYWYEDVN